MKPTQLTELFVNIKQTFVSFFSILMFVALGIGVFVGIAWTEPALQTAVEKLFDAGELHHFQINFPYGLTDDDVAQLKGVEGVTDVEPHNASFQTTKLNNDKLTFKVQGLGERIDALDVKEGALPTEPNEMALKATCAAELGLAVGDTVRFDHDASGGQKSALAELAEQGDSSPDAADDGMRFLGSDTFTITALVESPEYVALAKQTFGRSTTRARRRSPRAKRR